MPDISVGSTARDLSGVVTVPVANLRASHHSLKITCSNTAVTFTIKERDRSDVSGTFSAFDDNVVAANSKATFCLPGAVEFEITPSDLAAAYSVSVSSF
mgnify:CR=1 FL=1